MFRDTHYRDLSWSDKTRTAICISELDKCEKWLKEHQGNGIFTCTKQEAFSVWQRSFDGVAHPFLAHMYTREELQQKVMLQLPSEALLLSQQEEELVTRLMETGGIPLGACDAPDAAQNLVMRMWASVMTLQDVPALILQPPVRLALSAVMSGEEYQFLRKRLMFRCRELDAMLYLYGAMSQQEAEDAVADVVRGTFADDEKLIRRFVQLNFDWSMNKNRQPVLIHPGLADPDSVAVRTDCLENDLPAEVILSAANGALPQEVPCFQRLLGLLNGAMRPEYQESTTVQDMALLCKQHVSLQEVERSLSAALIVQPTDAMRSALKEMHHVVPRWNTMRSGVLQ